MSQGGHVCHFFFCREGVEKKTERRHSFPTPFLENITASAIAPSDDPDSFPSNSLDKKKCTSLQDLNHLKRLKFIIDLCNFVHQIELVNLGDDSGKYANQSHHLSYHFHVFLEKIQGKNGPCPKLLMYKEATFAAWKFLRKLPTRFGRRWERI